jgi:uncharacterized protein (TIRG00374 family)
MNKTLAVVLKGAVSLGLLAILITKVDTESVTALLSRVSAGPLAYAMALQVGTFFLQADRFRRIVHLARLTFTSALRITWIGQFFSQVLPGAVGGDIFRAWYLNRLGVDLRNSLVITLVDRIYGVIALLILLAVGIPWIWASSNDPLLALIASALVLGGMLAILLAASIGRLPAHWFRHRWLAAGHRFSETIRHRLTDLRVSLTCVGLSLIVQIFQSISLWIIAQMLQLDAPFIAMAFVTPLSNFAQMLPISIAGWGIRETVLIATLHTMNIPPSEALAMSLIYGVLAALAALPGLPIWLAARSRPLTRPLAE